MWLVARALASPSDGLTALTPTFFEGPGMGIIPDPEPESADTHHERLRVLGFVLMVCIRCLGFLPDVISQATYRCVHCAVLMRLLDLMLTSPPLFSLLWGPDIKIDPQSLMFAPRFATFIHRLNYVFQTCRDDEIDTIDFSLIPEADRYISLVNPDFYNGNEVRFVLWP